MIFRVCCGSFRFFFNKLFGLGLGVGFVVECLFCVCRFRFSIKEGGGIGKWLVFGMK